MKGKKKREREQVNFRITVWRNCISVGGGLVVVAVASSGGDRGSGRMVVVGILVVVTVVLSVSRH